MRIPAFVCLMVCAGTAHGSPLTAPQIDATVSRAMHAFAVPGIAVGIVKDGQLVFAKGYGVRKQGESAAVDPDTLFQIGSNTKAFTAAALALLVDEGKIHWDDKVVEYLPDFQLYDPYVTREFTLRDLLTHRSGLREGAGDLMFYPATDFSRKEIIHGLRYLKPTSGFRSHFDYDNLLYMVAGEIIPVVTGESWESFVRQRIFDPLGMKACAPTYDSIHGLSNVAAPHVLRDGHVSAVPVESIVSIAPAGGINCNVRGLSRWLTMLLANDHRLLSPERIAEVFTLTTPEPLNPQLAQLTATHFKGYGLGWNVQDSHGFVRISHTGGVPGSVSWISLIPELHLAVIVLTNQEETVAMEAVGNQILDSWLGAPKKDWVALATAYKAQRDEAARAALQAVATTAGSAGHSALALQDYAGRYSDPWRGEATVRLENDTLVLKFSRTSKLEGRLQPYSGNVFIVRWEDRSLNADAFVRFQQGFDRPIEGMTLQAISPTTDFSFDFQDLDFKALPVAASGPTG